MQAGQADIWQNADAQSRAEMTRRASPTRPAGLGSMYHLMPNTDGPRFPAQQAGSARSVWSTPSTRKRICGAIGYGIYKPIYAVAPEGEWGADAIKVKRDYDPAKAKELLVAAGYADGCPIDLLAVAETGGSNAVRRGHQGLPRRRRLRDQPRHRRSGPVLRFGVRHRAGRTWR